MQLSTRLQALAACIPEASRLIDVGTDHAYIPIYLMKHKIIEACIATDIHQGPLEKAKTNMAIHQISGIDLRLIDGLSGIAPGEGDVILIAGMGGYLIVNILKNNLSLVKTAKKIILQPQQDISEVRRFLHTVGLKIEDEQLVKEDDKYYVIIIAVLGNESYDKEYEYEYGKRLIAKGEFLFKEYLITKQKKHREIYEHIKAIDSEYARRRKKELEKMIKMQEEVIQCIY